jgi:hypothetical protein
VLCSVLCLYFVYLPFCIVFRMLVLYLDCSFLMVPSVFFLELFWRCGIFLFIFTCVLILKIVYHMPSINMNNNMKNKQLHTVGTCINSISSHSYLFLCIWFRYTVVWLDDFRVWRRNSYSNFLLPQLRPYFQLSSDNSRVTE